MNTVVTRQKLAEIIHALNKKEVLVFDCETTGLKPYHGAGIFSVAVSDLTDSYYFNFKTYPGLSDDFVLERSWLKPLMDRPRLWIAHNAKFDLHFTDRANIKPNGAVIDTEVLARLFENHHQYTAGGYSLDACAKRWLGKEKDDRVKAWMDENNAFTTHFNPEGRQEKLYFFDQVPFEIISEYAMKDASLTGALYLFLNERMYETKSREIERDLTPVLFEMEKVGILIDRKYCADALQFEQGRVAKSLVRLAAACGGEFTDSSKCLTPLLLERGFVLPTTEAGNPQVTDEVLRQKPDELAELILEHRDALKRANTYWANYLALSDQAGVIHPNFRQSGTVTGRMSCNNPNLQNIPTDDFGPYPVRRAFVPRDGFSFVSIDFAGMEFRLMLEYANQTDLIEKIKAGHDPHDATAELTGLTRKAAKTLNFMLLYGGGIAKIAKAIGITEAEAKDFKFKYFGRLPNVKRFIKQAQYSQATRGFTFNWAGRRYVLEIGKDGRDFSYKAANAIIQGGCAEICKLAMHRLSKFLSDKCSRMVLQVHDEILFEVHETELWIVPELRAIMETAYEAKNMPLTCSVSVSRDNFHDMVEIHNEELFSIRKKLSEIGAQQIEIASKHVVCEGSGPG